MQNGDRALLTSVVLSLRRPADHKPNYSAVCTLAQTTRIGIAQCHSSTNRQTLRLEPDRLGPDDESLPSRHSDSRAQSVARHALVEWLLRRLVQPWAQAMGPSVWRTLQGIHHREGRLLSPRCSGMSSSTPCGRRWWKGPRRTAGRAIGPPRDSMPRQNGSTRRRR